MSEFASQSIFQSMILKDLKAESSRDNYSKNTKAVFKNLKDQLFQNNKQEEHNIEATISFHVNGLPTTEIATIRYIFLKVLSIYSCYKFIKFPSGLNNFNTPKLSKIIHSFESYGKIPTAAPNSDIKTEDVKQLIKTLKYYEFDTSFEVIWNKLNECVKKSFTDCHIFLEHEIDTEFSIRKFIDQMLELERMYSKTEEGRNKMELDLLNFCDDLVNRPSKNMTIIEMLNQRLGTSILPIIKSYFTDSKITQKFLSDFMDWNKFTIIVEKYNALETFNKCYSKAKSEVYKSIQQHFSGLVYPMRKVPSTFEDICSRIRVNVNQGLLYDTSYKAPPTMEIIEISFNPRLNHNIYKDIKIDEKKRSFDNGKKLSENKIKCKTCSQFNHSSSECCLKCNKSIANGDFNNQIGFKKVDKCDGNNNNNNVNSDGNGSGSCSGSGSDIDNGKRNANSIGSVSNKCNSIPRKFRKSNLGEKIPSQEKASN